MPRFEAAAGGARRSVSESRAAAAVPACLFACLLPGAGHLYLRRRGRGLLYLGALLSLFFLGLAKQAGLSPHWSFLDDPLAFIVSAGQLAMGLPYYVARSLGLGVGRVTAPTYEYGLTFTAVAGLLNVLVVLDAYDIAVGRKA
jgi:hypothetical protein